MLAGSPSLWGETAMIAGGVASCSGGRSGWEYLLMTALSEQQRAKRSASSKLLNAISNPMLL